MTISMFATMFLFSLAGLSAQLLQTEGATRQRSYALAGAEAGLDFARKEFNKSLAYGVPTDIAPEDGQLSRDFGLPVQYIPQLGNRCRVMIRVSRIENDMLATLDQRGFPVIAPENNSSRRLDPVTWIPENKDWSQFTIPDPADAPNGAYAWKVEVTSYCGIFATSIRSVLVAFNRSNTGGFAPVQRPIGPGAIAGNSLTVGAEGGDISVRSVGDLTSAGQTIRTSEDPNSALMFKAALRTNGTMTTASNAQIVGDVEFSGPKGTSGYLLQGDGTAEIFGRVIANSDAAVDPSVFSYRNNSPDGSGDAIQAGADTFPGNPDSRVSDNRTPVPPGSESDATPLSPYPVTVPENVSPLPSFPSNVGNQDGSPPVVVQSGVSYVTPSFSSINASGSLIFNGSESQPTQIYVTDGLSAFSDDFGQPAIELNSKFISNQGNPSSLQVFYSGTRDVNLTIGGTDSPLSIVVYAPNATVRTLGKGRFTGALVGRNVSIGHDGEMLIDPESTKVLYSKSQDNSNGNSGNFVAPKPTHFTIVSWQQMAGQLVPLD